MTIALGSFTSGEIPEPLEYTFLDSDGNPITDIDDTWTTTFHFQRDGGDSIEHEASADAGKATYAWVDGDITDPGIWRGEFHAEGSELTFVSERIVWLVRAAIGGTDSLPPSGSIIDGGAP